MQQEDEVDFESRRVAVPDDLEYHPVQLGQTRKQVLDGALLNPWHIFQFQLARARLQWERSLGGFCVPGMCELYSVHVVSNAGIVLDCVEEFSKDIQVHCCKVWLKWQADMLEDELSGGALEIAVGFANSNDIRFAHLGKDLVEKLIRESQEAFGWSHGQLRH
jgi:hypothetical protein